MTERRIRTSGRPVYGRPPAVRSRPNRSWKWHLSVGQRRFVWLVAAVIVMVVVLGQAFAIRHVRVVGGGAGVPAEATQALKASRWTGNNLTFDAGAYAAALLKADPSLKAVKTRRVLPTSLVVTVTPKQPSIGWVTGNQAYLLDNTGAIIGSLPGDWRAPAVYDDSNLPVSSGQAVTSTRFVSFVTGVAAGLPALGLAGTKYEIKDTTYDLYVSTNKGYQLILDTSRPAAGELSDLGVVLRNFKASGKAPAQYVDLRIAGRAYYK